MTSEIFPKMRKVYYIYNPQTQTYDRIYPTVRQRALSILRRLFIGMGLGAGSFIVLLLIFGSPSEKELRKENSKLQAQYNVLSRRLDEAMGVMVVSCMQIVGLGCHQGGVGLLREDAALTVHNPGLAEEGTREEFKVEAHFSDEFLGNGAVKVYGHLYVFTFAFHVYRIYKVEVRVNHRVESGEMA